MTVVRVPGAELYVERAGSGASLLSISGSGSTLSEGTGPAALPLSRAFDVVGWDHRGLGRSTSDAAPVTMADFAAIAYRISGAVHRSYDGGHAFLFQDPTAWVDALAFLGGEHEPDADLR